MPSSADAAPPLAAAELPRRLALQLGLAASGLLAAGGLVRYLSYDSAPAVPTTFELDAPAAYPPGTALHLPQAGAWLLRDAAGLYALATRCPHLGCTLERQPAGFRCPCHGSEFAPDGQVRRGPADQPLTYLTLTLSSLGHVIVHTDQPASALERLA
jgi:nitrite reductase/ring-hydroxylating ferredoxin subunit